MTEKKDEAPRSLADLNKITSAKYLLCFFLSVCEHNTCSAHYQPRAAAAQLVAGTYVTSFLILLMWKEKAPLLSPDLVTKKCDHMFSDLK